MAEIEVVRLGLKDYDELFTVLNRAFGEARNKYMCFQEELPRMARRTEETMNRHFAVRVDGKMVAALGVYPLPAVINGKHFLFSTVGNVGTLPEHTGKGYMSMLLAEAMRELDRIGADASRLGGKRERYNRYGYEQCGTCYCYALDQLPQPAQRGITFRRLERTDGEVLDWAIALHRHNDIYALRETRDDFYDNYVNFRNVPYAALNAQGKPIAVLSVDKSGEKISEIEADTLEHFQQVLDAWRSTQKTSVVLPTGKPAENAYLKSICSEWHVAFPSMFYIRNFVGIVQALLEMKAKYTALPDFSQVLEIEGYGRIAITVRNGQGHCEKTDAPADRHLSWLEAETYLFGTQDEQAAAGTVLPLPLSWFGQDRV